MKTLVEILASTGVNLTKDVSVIMETETISGDFIPTVAIRGRVTLTLPQEAIGKCPNYDPSYDLALLLTSDDEHKLAIFSITDGAELYALSQGGVAIVHEMFQIFFGQTPFFMARQARLAKQLHK